MADSGILTYPSGSFLIQYLCGDDENPKVCMEQSSTFVSIACPGCGRHVDVTLANSVRPNASETSKVGDTLFVTVNPVAELNTLGTVGNRALDFLNH